MTPRMDTACAAISRFYFVERRRLDAIAAELRLPRSTVRRALVLTGGVRPQPPIGPYRKECDS